MQPGLPRCNDAQAMSQTLNPPLVLAEATRQLQTYRWPELWQAVRHLQPEPYTQGMPVLAIKAMLLAGWWQEVKTKGHPLY